MRCPELEEILDFLDNRLERSRANVLRSHIESCVSCRETSEWASNTKTAIQSKDLVDAPEYLIKKAIAVFPQKKASFKEWVLAKLSFDSGLVPLTAGVRSSQTAPRQRIYETDTYKIILMSEQGADVTRWTGQIVATQPEAETSDCLVEIVKGKKSINKSVTNQNGEFLLTSPPGKQFELRVHGQPESVLIQNL
jgi:hypothetical protein